MPKFRPSSRKRWRLLPAALLLLTIGGAAAWTLLVPDSGGEQAPAATAGKIDLTGQPFDEAIALRGQWEFYPGRLLEPASWDAGAGAPPQPAGYMDVPGYWNRQPIDGRTYPLEGCATLRLTALLPEELPLLAVKLGNTFTSYRLWADGRETASAGVVACSREEAVPRQIVQVAPLERGDGPELELVLQLSNYDYYKSGFQRSPLIGTEAQLEAAYRRDAAVSWFAFGACGIIAFYHLLVFAVRRRHLASLYVGSFSLLMSVRTLLVNDRLVYTIFPELDWQWFAKALYLIFYLGLLLLTRMLRELYPAFVGRRLVRASDAVGGLGALLCLLTEQRVYEHALLPAELYACFVMAYGAGAIAVAVARGERGALLFLCGFAVLAATIIHDFFYMADLTRAASLAPLGFLAFSLFQSVLLARQYAGSFAEAEQLARRLLAMDRLKDEWSQTLEQRVRERTAELQEAMGRLESAQRQLVQAEKMASLGSLVAGVAHEINTPIGIGVTASSHLAQRAERLRQLYASGQMKRTELERFLAESSESASILLSNLQRTEQLVRSFKQVAAGQASELPQRFEAKQAALDVLISLSPLLRESGVRLDVRVEAEEGLETTGYVGAFYQILTNLLVNSVTHAYPEGGSGIVAITISRLRERAGLYVEFEDDGVGMEPELAARIFDPFVTTRRGRGGTGLGLSLVYSLVATTWGGAVRIWSEPGRGARFELELPEAAEETGEERAHERRDGGQAQARNRS